VGPEVGPEVLLAVAVMAEVPCVLSRVPKLPILTGLTCNESPDVGVALSGI
jgi:hypothetical protein